MGYDCQRHYPVLIYFIYMYIAPLLTISYTLQDYEYQIWLPNRPYQMIIDTKVHVALCS